MALRLRRGTDTERQLITPLEGELIYTTDTKLLYAGDGTTAGGTLVTGSGGGGGGAAGAISTLSDVNGGYVNGDLLQFDGLNFVPKTIDELLIWDNSLTANLTGNTTGLHTGPVDGDVIGSVFADDSTLLVDGVNGVIPAANLSGTATITVIGDLTGNAVGAHTGTLDGDLTGSVFADDSSVIIDGLSGNGHFSNIISTGAQLNIGRTTGISELRLESFQTKNRLNINTVDKTGDLSAYSGYYGTLNFGFQDATTDRSDCTIRGQASDMRIAHDTVTTLINDESKYFTLKEGKFGFGTYTPAEKLDVRGNIVATGTIQPGVYADAAARDAALTAPTAGQMVYITDVAKFQGNTDSTITGWVNLN